MMCPCFIDDKTGAQRGENRATKLGGEPDFFMGLISQPEVFESPLDAA